MSGKKWIIWLLLFLASAVVKADILVFIHGFDSNSTTWRKNGIVPQLQMLGWQDSGNLILNPAGQVLASQPPELKPFRMVTVDLPSTAPIQVQAGLLLRYIQFLQQQSPNEKNIVLIGHSAGGIVARYLMVTQPQLPISKLITIASPHRGSGMAEAVELASKMYIGDMFSMIGEDSIKDSEELMNQLQREEPGSFLFWLNRQPHPPAKYYSIIRMYGKFPNKDYLVPRENQDMRLVPGIRDGVLSFGSYGKHELHPRDAALIISLVNPVGRY